MKFEIAKLIFHSALNVMKQILSLSEFKFGKKSDEHKYFKSQIMDFFYKELEKIFEILKDKKIIETCKCKSSLRNGYQSCSYCGGSGYKNVKDSENENANEPCNDKKK